MRTIYNIAVLVQSHGPSSIHRAAASRAAERSSVLVEVARQGGSGEVPPPPRQGATSQKG